MPERQDGVQWPLLLAVGLGLVLAVALQYGSVRGFDFVTYDDLEYVTANPYLAGDVRWPLTAIHASNWHPVTWWSHMIDVRLFGLNAGAHHLVSVAIHATNAVLLLSVLVMATGAVGRSALCAALFALHPLNVESVAWISERKNVLSTMLLLLMLMAWVTWTKRGGVWRYLLAIGLFALGLMAKPMLVTVPLLLLALDLWPLRRGVRILEKLPLAALSALSCIVTLIAQSRGGAVQGLETIPLDQRLANAVIAYAWYPVKAVWPSSLSVFYPHPATLGERVPVFAVLGAVVLLVVISIAATRRRWLAFGWIWYVVALIPVVGIVQVGHQAYADRYAYVPLIGIFIAVVWTVAETNRRWLPAAAVVVLMALGVAGGRQVRVWKDTGTLWENALKVDARNWMAWGSAGAWYSSQGNYERALYCYDRALRLHPDAPATLYNAGYALAAQRRFAEAVPFYREAIRRKPQSALYRANLALAYHNLARPADAIAAARAALVVDRDSPDALYTAALVTARSGMWDEAAGHYSRLRQVHPGMAGRLEDAIRRR
jgi:hypothetical protein